MGGRSAGSLDDLPDSELEAVLDEQFSTASHSRGEEIELTVVHHAVADTIEGVIAQVMDQVRPGDHLLCMSNGGFGGIHTRLLQAVQSRH